MIYDKLPVVFLSTLASEKKDSTNSVIAAWIMNHPKEASSMGIKQLADACHVGLGSVSRFCKDIGLNDFAELKEMLGKTSRSFARPEEETYEDRLNAWYEGVSSSLRMVRDSLDRKKLEMLCRDLATYETVAVFGMLKGISAAISMQVDLQMLGKHVYTAVSYAEQMEYLKRAGKDTLIVVFSYTGSYFEYESFRQMEKHLVLPKIWMICGTDREKPWFVDDVITFASRQDHAGHPYQLLAAENLLMQEYAALIREETE